MKKENVVAMTLSILGGALFGALSGAAKLIEDDAYADVKEHVKTALAKKKEDAAEEEEEAQG